jgi:hypothetical protein
MTSLESIGRALLIVGVVTILLGLLLTLIGRLPFLGRLPGDIVIRWGNFTLYIPIAASILLSLLLTVLLNVILRLFRR